MSSNELYNRLKKYINQERNNPTGDMDDWIYEKILIKMDEIKTELDNESPFKTIRRIVNKYPPMDAKLGEEIMRRYRNGEDIELWIKDSQSRIEDIKNGKVSPEESLNSLIGSGICDSEGNLTEPYKITKEQRTKTKEALLYDEPKYTEDMYEKITDSEEEKRQFINDNIEEIIELETNTECEHFEKLWFGEDIKLKEQLTNSLKLALIKFSYGQVDEEKADNISKQVISNVDIFNSAFNHKGINWLAREILKSMGINTYKVANKDKVNESIVECTNKYNKALNNLADN